MRAIVTYGSQRGGTEGLAEWLSEALTAQGVPTEVVAVEQAPDLKPYDAVIVGGSLYMNRWNKQARRFVKQHSAELRSKAVWLFSSGPLDDSATEQPIPPIKSVAALMARIGARGHRTFGGRLEPDAQGFAAAMAKTGSGDWRDRSEVNAWAAEIALQLVPA